MPVLVELPFNLGFETSDSGINNGECRRVIFIGFGRAFFDLKKPMR